MRTASTPPVNLARKLGLLRPMHKMTTAIALRAPQPVDKGWVVQQHGEIYARAIYTKRGFKLINGEGYIRSLGYATTLVVYQGAGP